MARLNENPRRQAMRWIGAAWVALLCAACTGPTERAGQAAAATVKSLDPGQALNVIAFGSCVHQNHPQPIWRAVNAEAPDLFVFLGDNVYGDTENMRVLKAKYDKLGSKPGFIQLRENSQVIATWDDHDFGANDTGRQYPKKHESRRIMLDFWREPADSARRTRDDGIYTAYQFGPPGRRVQVILLDLRWNRSPIARVSSWQNLTERKPKQLGPYSPIDDQSATLVGEAQWQWLAQQLREPADLRIIGSSIQVLAEFTGWEAWANYPHERQRLLDLLDQLERDDVVLISGDTHWSELSRIARDEGQALWEMTSSGLTQEWKDISPNQHRVGKPYGKANFGLIEIDWSQAKPMVTLSIKDVEGNTVMRQRVP